MQQASAAHDVGAAGPGPALRSAKRILLPTDFSDGAELALSMAIDTAKLLGAVLEIVYVHNIPSYLVGVPEAEPSILPLTQQEKSSIDGVLTKQAERGRAAGVSCVTTSLEGNPAYEILEYADRQGIDLIVMGTHGRTGLRHVVFGSVAERVVQRASCPVLVVPSRKRSDHDRDGDRPP